MATTLEATDLALVLRQAAGPRRGLAPAASEDPSRGRIIGTAHRWPWGVSPRRSAQLAQGAESIRAHHKSGGVPGLSAGGTATAPGLLNGAGRRGAATLGHCIGVEASAAGGQRWHGR